MEKMSTNKWKNAGVLQVKMRNEMGRKINTSARGNTLTQRFMDGLAYKAAIFSYTIIASVKVPQTGMHKHKITSFYLLEL